MQVVNLLYVLLEHTGESAIQSIILVFLLYIHVHILLIECILNILSYFYSICFRNDTGAASSAECYPCTDGFYCPNDTVNSFGIPCDATYECPEVRKRLLLASLPLMCVLLQPLSYLFFRVQLYQRHVDPVIIVHQ